MLNIPASTKIFICNQAVDMRYLFDALSGLVQTHFGMNALSGHLFEYFGAKRIPIPAESECRSSGAKRMLIPAQTE
jgi:IS66 Orf2 like protein